MKDTAVIMTIAGSDSGGGAGIQADIKTMTALGAFGISAITVLTAQNGEGVRGVHAPDPSFIQLQLQTLLDGFPVAAAKTGMLFSAAIMECVADALQNKSFPLVVDPVAISHSGHKLLMDDAVSALIDKILPLADVITPNVLEAELLTGQKLRTTDDIAPIANSLLSRGAKAVLLKAGKLGSSTMQTDVMTDWLCLPGKTPQAFPHKFVDTPNRHGTGCTLSAGLATFLGQGKPLADAIHLAHQYLVTGLETSFTPGIGCGPPNFFANAPR